MSLLDRIGCFLFPMDCKNSNKRAKTPMDQYIERNNPQSLEEVERLAKQYYNSTSNWRGYNDLHR